VSVVVEIAGIDGSGKSTLAERLRGHFAALGRPAETRRTHSLLRRWCSALGTRHGLGRGDWIGHDAVELAVAFEYLRESRRLDRVPPGEVLVLEPYVLNSAAIAAALGTGNLPGLLDVYCATPAPNLTVLLDLDPAAAMRRILVRPGTDNFVLTERHDPFIGKLHAAFGQVLPTFTAAGREVLVLDGAAPVETNLGRVVDRLAELETESVARKLGIGSGGAGMRRPGRQSRPRRLGLCSTRRGRDAVGRVASLRAGWTEKSARRGGAHCS
jgi:thymidylate kinase